MSLDLHALTDAALTLDPGDRLALASLLIDSVEDPADPGWEASWTEELVRRTTAANARAVRGAPWSDVRARLLRDLANR
jgi:putative addiction module component (TIGR02574 family)